MAKQVCLEIFSNSSVLACTVVDSQGEVLAAKSRGFREERALRSRLGQVVAVIWGAIRRGVSVGGELRMVIVEFERFKSIAVPLDRQNVVVLVTVPVKTDQEAILEEVLGSLRQLSRAK
ncbi:MAG TPA: hypothetical protein VEJ36_06615 [Nitrososphaerales archaeon]|nr:hypothetical protein [Nitrososphaerales archaeon]